MSLVENIRFLCKKAGTSIPKLEKKLSFGNGAIYNWDESSPSVDRLQKVADCFGVSLDFLNTGFDKEIINTIKDLSRYIGTQSYFPDDVLVVLAPEIEKLKKEYWDVPLDLGPTEMIGLLTEFPVTTEFKKDLLETLKEALRLYYDKRHDITTLAAHHDGDEWTEEELTDIEKFKEFVRSKRNAKS